MSDGREQPNTPRYISVRNIKNEHQQSEHEQCNNGNITDTPLQ